MKTNQTTALPEMPEQLIKEVERLNSFSFKFTCLYEELTAYLDMLGLEYRADGIEVEDRNLEDCVSNIRFSLNAIASEIHREFAEDLYTKKSQSDNS